MQTNLTVTWEERIKEILEQHLKARDSDVVLFGFILKKHFPNKLSGPVTDLLKAWESTSLIHMSSVSRLRRKVQKEHPNLRGERYGERQESQQEWRGSLMDLSNTTN